MTKRIGYYGLAKRDLDRGGEGVTIVSELPVDWEEINAIAVERDKLELAGNPNSPYRYFPTELTDEELADMGITREPIAAETTPGPAPDAGESTRFGRRRVVLGVVLALLALAAAAVLL